MSKESGILIISFTCHCFSPLSINHHYLCPGAHLHMNNPKTLQSGPVAERMYRDDSDLPKHKKRKYEKGEKKVNVTEYKGQLLLIFFTAYCD